MKDADGNEILVGDELQHARYPSTIWTVKEYIDNTISPYFALISPDRGTLAIDAYNSHDYRICGRSPSTIQGLGVRF